MTEKNILRTKSQMLRPGDLDKTRYRSPRNLTLEPREAIHKVYCGMDAMGNKTFVA
jgi:hypothetical protein